MAVKIILIDDDLDNLEALSLTLTFSNYSTFAFLNGDNLLERTRAISPDLIIIDVMLGYEDGRKLCLQLKHSADFSHIPVVLISASPKLLQPMLCQAYACIEKPFDIGQVTRLIENHLLIN